MNRKGLQNLTQGGLVKTSTRNASGATAPMTQMAPPPPNDAFVNALSESPFTIFRQISDLCYYDWNIHGNAYGPKSLDDVWKRLRLHQKPPRHAPIELLHEIPFRLAHTDSFGYYNDAFPREQPKLAQFAAALKCGLSIHDIDFLFVGPSMGYLSGVTSSLAFGPGRTFVAEVIPGTNIVAFSSRCRPYFQNLQNRGYQFERHVQQQPALFDPNEQLPLVSMHVQLMRVDDTYNVLSSSQIDCMDPTGLFPVEVKTHLTLTRKDPNSPTKLLGRQKAIWQLLAMGSPYLIAAEINNLKMTRLEKVTMAELTHKLEDVGRVEASILEGMHRLKEILLSPWTPRIPHQCVVDETGIMIKRSIGCRSHFPEYLSRHITNEL